ncbi:hypothetical protein [Streptomyces sp. bgisy100]|uniref:hypothetical protein n=1 Tax=Streptomyces sp. bgisy100 TaxID=3413783 RepID=UPI003D723C6B
MPQDHELEPGEYRARGGIVRKMVPGEALFAIPKARELADKQGRKLGFDFLDDAAVLRMLRLRHYDDTQLRGIGMKLGLPSALALTGLFLYWGGYVQYWESSKSQTTFYVITGAVVAVILILYIVFLARHWGDRARQNVRARAAAYRDIAHTAGRHGAELPEFYPHYGPYPFAANFHPEAAELRLPGEECSS